MLGGGGGVLGLLSVRPHFCWGGVGAAKGLLPCFLVPKGNQPTACTLALWWLKFGPTETGGGGGGAAQEGIALAPAVLLWPGRDLFTTACYNSMWSSTSGAWTRPRQAIA